MDKSLNMRAWLKVKHDSLVDMGVNTLNAPVLQLLYAQRWTCIVDTLSAISTMIFTKFKQFLSADIFRTKNYNYN